MALKKPSDIFGKEEKTNLPVTKTDDTLREELSKVESLSEQIFQLQQELSQKVIKNDLESLVLSQINKMQEDFKNLRIEFEQSNERDISNFKEGVSQLTEIFNNLVEIEIPKYKKKITKNELFVNEQVNQLQQAVDENIAEIREEIDSKFDNIADVVDNNIQYFNQQLQETSSEVKKTVDTYGKLSKIVESRISKENEQLEQYSQVIEDIQKGFNQLQQSLNEKVSISQEVIEEKFVEYQKEFKGIRIQLENSVHNHLKDYQKELTNIKSDVVVNEQHIKKVDKYLQEHHQELIELKEEVFDGLEKLTVGNLQENIERLEKKIDYIRETYSKIEPDVVVKEVIREGLLNEPPNTKNSDTLTPLNQNFVTLDQLQQHYRLFINRIQQQLSTIGGGGETQLKYLDDIVGIATNASAYDGKVLSYNHSIGKFEFVTGGGAGSQTLDDILQLGNTSSLGISVGISTFNNVIIGGATTDLVVNGSARVTGILTIGTSSITLNGVNNTISIGTGITLTESGGANYSGVITATSFNGNATSATYATTAGIATALTPTSSINTTGVITATSFSGSGVNLTNLNATNLTSGIVPAARITDTSALTVAGDLYVSGNISFGGTTTQLNTQQLEIVDPDIVLGIGTSFSPTDNTANHGGIAIASTEGSPLVSLMIAPGETNPDTYKKFMWFKTNTAGLGTDAWLSNYAVGIGSTQFPIGTRLAAGSVQFTENDLRVVRNINASGIVTSSNLNVGTGVTIYGSSGIVSTRQLYINSFPVNQSYTVSHTTGSLGVGATADFTISAGNVFHLLSVTSSTPAWIRVYGTSSGRSSDTRTSPGGTLPASGSEYYAELVTTSTPQTIRLSPVPIVQGTTGNAFIRVINTDTVSRSIQLNFKVITIEV